MAHIKRREFVGMCSTGVVGAALNGVQSDGAAPAESSVRKTFVKDRKDGRFVDTAGFMHAYIKSHKPKLAFDAGMEAREFPVWREKLRAKVRELMAFPEVPPQPEPKCISVEQRNGYQLQRLDQLADDIAMFEQVLRPAVEVRQFNACDIDAKLTIERREDFLVVNRPVARNSG